MDYQIVRRQNKCIYIYIVLIISLCKKLVPNGRDHRQKRLLELRTAFHSPAFEKTQAPVAMDSDSDMCCSEGDDGIHSESADDTDETSFDSLETDTVTYKYLQSEEVAGQIDDLLDGLVAVTSVNHLFLKNFMLLPGCLLGRLTIIRLQASRFHHLFIHRYFCRSALSDATKNVIHLSTPLQLG